MVLCLEQRNKPKVWMNLQALVYMLCLVFHREARLSLLYYGGTHYLRDRNSRITGHRRIMGALHRAKSQFFDKMFE
ncbi:unnamed protein product, partial [Mesorhabditis spiculigera]